MPSVATFVHLAASAPNQPPTATITSPASNVTVNPGQAVSFAGTGSDPDGTIASYSWTFPGGTPASSALANPGNVTYNTPGTYVASFKVTDNGGLTSAAATRTITVPDFSLSASPSSQRGGEFGADFPHLGRQKRTKSAPNSLSTHPSLHRSDAAFNQHSP